MPICKFKNRDGSTSIESVPNCNRCGFCCLVESCPVGVLAFGPGPGSGAPGGAPAAPGSAPGSPGPGAVVVGRRPGRCPGLSFDSEGLAVCALAENEGGRFDRVWSRLGAVGAAARARVLGFGSGCCIRARLVSDGVTYNFATLSDPVKLKIVKRQLETD